MLTYCTLFIFILFLKDRERDREEEGEAGSLEQGVPHGARAQDPGTMT